MKPTKKTTPPYLLLIVILSFLILGLIQQMQIVNYASDYACKQTPRKVSLVTPPTKSEKTLDATPPMKDVNSKNNQK